MGGLLITWDGSAAAEHAVRVAADECGERSATILHLSRPADHAAGTAGGDAALLMRSLQVVQGGVALASRCGLAASARVESSSIGRVDAILGVAADVGAARIVVGAGEPREWHRELQERSRVPVLVVPLPSAQADPPPPPSAAR